MGITYKVLPLLGLKGMTGVLQEGQRKISWSKIEGQNERLGFKYMADKSNGKTLKHACIAILAYTEIAEINADSHTASADDCGFTMVFVGSSPIMNERRLRQGLILNKLLDQVLYLTIMPPIREELVLRS